MTATAQRPITIINTPLEGALAWPFSINNRVLLGYILAWKFTGSGTQLNADLEVPDPENPESKMKVVAVLDFVKWSGGRIDPLEVRGRLSYDNKALLKTCVSSLDGGADVEVSWRVVCYDDKEKKYFKKFHTDDKNILLAITEGTEVDIKDSPNLDVKHPRNYHFGISLTAKSDAGAQMVCCAESTNQKFTLEMGAVQKG
jgi:hypothetical protein